MRVSGLIQWVLTIFWKDYERPFCAMGQGEWSCAGLVCADTGFVFLLCVFDAEWLIAVTDNSKFAKQKSTVSWGFAGIAHRAPAAADDVICWRF